MLITIELLNGKTLRKAGWKELLCWNFKEKSFLPLKSEFEILPFLPRIEHQQLVFILIQNRNTLTNRKCYFMQDVCRHFFFNIISLNLICLVIGVGTFNSLFIFTVPLFSGKSGSCQTNEKSSWTWQQISTRQIETSFFFACFFTLESFRSFFFFLLCLRYSIIYHCRWFWRFHVWSGINPVSPIILAIFWNI